MHNPQRNSQRFLGYARNDKQGIGVGLFRFVIKRDVSDELASKKPQLADLRATTHGVSGVIPFVMTTKLQVRGSWNEVKGKLKQKYSQLTDDDLSFAEGKEDELLGRLQRRLGKSKEDLRAEIEKL